MAQGDFQIRIDFEDAISRAFSVTPGQFQQLADALTGGNARVHQLTYHVSPQSSTTATILLNLRSVITVEQLAVVP